MKKTRTPEAKGFRMTAKRRMLMAQGMTLEEAIANSSPQMYASNPENVVRFPTMAAHVPHEDTRTDKEIYEDILNRFATLDIMVRAAVKGINRSMVVSSGAGTGKTVGVTNALAELNANYEHIKGSITPKQLYSALFRNKEVGKILLMDDSDSIFKDELSLNLLKAVTDTGDDRIVSWYTSRPMIDEDGETIPQFFKFNGSIIFITNKNFEQEIQKNNSLSPHLEALRDRSTYISVGVSTRREYLIRIKQVIDTSDIMRDFDDDQVQEIIDYIEENQDNFVNLSVRVIKKIKNLILIDPINWKSLAKTTLLK